MKYKTVLLYTQLHMLLHIYTLKYTEWVYVHVYIIQLLHKCMNISMHAYIHTWINVIVQVAIYKCYVKQLVSQSLYIQDEGWQLTESLCQHHMLVINYTSALYANHKCSDTKPITSMYLQPCKRVAATHVESSQVPVNSFALVDKFLPFLSPGHKIGEV